MKRILTTLFTIVLLCVSGLSQVSCNEIETLNKGWWYYEVTGIRTKDSGSDFSEVDNAFNTYFAHGATYEQAEAEWKRFTGKIREDKIVIEGTDSCTVTLYWDTDYENPGLGIQVVGSRTWCNRSEEQRY